MDLSTTDNVGETLSQDFDGLHQYALKRQYHAKIGPLHHLMQDAVGTATWVKLGLIEVDRQLN